MVYGLWFVVYGLWFQVVSQSLTKFYTELHSGVGETGRLGDEEIGGWETRRRGDEAMEVTE